MSKKHCYFISYYAVKGTFSETGFVAFAQDHKVCSADIEIWAERIRRDRNYNSLPTILFFAEVEDDAG